MDNGTYTVWEAGAYIAPTPFSSAEVWSRTADSDAIYTYGFTVRGRIYTNFSGAANYVYDDTHWPSLHASMRSTFPDATQYRYRFTFAANDTNTTSAWDWQAATFSVGDSAPMPVTTTTYTTPAVSVDAPDYDLVLKITSALPAAPAGYERWVDVVVAKIELITADTDYDDETDGFDPGVSWPATDAPSAQPSGEGSATVLEMVREFSAKVRRAVRIVDSKTIRMVDPNERMPDGLMQADADDMYYLSNQSYRADENVLRLRTGRQELQVTAGIVTNDVRILTAGWKIPGRLPVYDLDPSPVKRVSMTFTPTQFTASVDFHLPDPPLSVRRASP